MAAQIIKFALTGLLNTLIDFGVFNLLIALTGTHNPLLIGLFNTLAVGLAMSNSYFLNRSWTFARHNEKNGQIQRFIIASLIGIIINSGTVIFISKLPIGTVLSPYILLNAAKILGAFFSTSWNFLIYRSWVFGSYEPRSVFQAEGFIPGMISIIIPAYNEKKRLPQRLRLLADTLAHRFPLEIIVIDDGSRDNTLDTVSELAREYSFIRHLRHKSNQGKGAAVRTGMCNAAGEYLIFTDADDTYTPEHITSVTEKLLQGDEVVIACRKGLARERLEGESFWRCWQGKAFNLLVQLLLLPGIRDSQCGLKGFSNRAAAQIFPRQNIKGFAFDVEILALLKSLQIPVTELSVAGVDCEGSTVHHLLAPLAMARDIIKIKLALLFNRYDLPGHTSIFNRTAWAGSLFLLALLARIPWLWEVPRYVDELKEVKLAYQIYQGQVLPLHNAAHDIGALHNYILAGIFKIMGTSIYLPRLYVAVTSALTVVLIYYIGKRIFNQWVGIAAAFLLLGNGMHILVTHMAWSNCTTPFFFCLAWLALINAEEKKSGAWFVIAAFLWALTLQTHSSVIVYILAVVIYTLRPAFRRQALIKTRYYLGAAAVFMLAYANMIYFNLITRGGSFTWLRYKGYAVESQPGIISYLHNLREMFIELLRTVSSNYSVYKTFGEYLNNPWFSLALGLMMLGAYIAYKQKKTLLLLMMGSAFLIFPWINHRYVFFLATRYIMPVVLCALLLIALGMVTAFAYLYELLGEKRSLKVPAITTLILLSVLQIIPFYSYCSQKAGTNQSNRQALQVFQKAMELSDRRSTLVVLDKSVTLENDPLPYLLTLARQPYLVTNPQVLTCSQMSQGNIANYYKGKRVVGIISADNFKTLRSSLNPHEVDSYSCKLIMPPTAHGERRVYVLDLGYQN